MANPIQGKLPGYETTIITRAEMTDENLKTLNERLKAVVTNYTGELVLSEDWGKKKLAYTIQKESRGQYTYMVYTGTGDVVHELERNLRLHEHVLRFLTVNLDKEFDIEQFQKRRTEIQAASKRREEEREARREERNAERRGYDDRGDRGDYRKHEAATESFEDMTGPMADEE
ncbi:MAG: 30S ribosomal protein S6 [Methylotenera sp.]|nr:30S ribosomal protein S6 [Oligoflexia bacterium]